MKIRGFRIEPGEIETLLGSSSEVQDAVVVAVEGKREKRLVAYVVPAREDLQKEELRDYLKTHLPDYMMPDAFVFLDVLPVTSNGKIDRAALPKPGEEGERRPAEAPRNQMEQILMEVWQRVLGEEELGTNDNFFELGGDSILAIQAVAMAQEKGVRLAASDLFVAQSIAELARLAQWADPALARRGPVAGLAHLTPIQRWFLDRPPVQPNHFNQAVSLEAAEPLSLPALQRALEALMEHHDALRMRFIYDRNQWRSEIQPVETRLEDRGPQVIRLDLSWLEDAHRRSVLQTLTAQTHSSLHLERGPIQRLMYFDLGSGCPARLLWVIHHLVVDGVSWRILLADLLLAYRQVEAGASIHLPPRGTSWQEWRNACKSMPSQRR